MTSANRLPTFFILAATLASSTSTFDRFGETMGVEGKGVYVGTALILLNFLTTSSGVGASGFLALTVDGTDGSPVDIGAVPATDCLMRGAEDSLFIAAM